MPWKATSRAPRRTPRKTPADILAAILDERRAHPTWGARKIKSILTTRGIETPGHGAIERAMAKAGLVSQRRQRRRFDVPPPGKLRPVAAPNEVWCIDDKGQFRLGVIRSRLPISIVASSLAVKQPPPSATKKRAKSAMISSVNLGSRRSFARITARRLPRLA